MRVVAGRFGGRRLRAPRGSATRPTADRVKEALFSILGPVDDAVVLDLYAGSGALGIEALSRGARRVVFVESAAAAATVLRENLAELGAMDAALVLTVPVERAARGILAAGTFDIVFADPPYADVGTAARALDALVGDGALADGARAILEHGSRDEPELARWDLASRRRYGDTTLSFFAIRS